MSGHITPILHVCTCILSLQALSELAMERSSTTPKSRAPSTRVTSGVRRVGGGAASITLPTTPGHMTVGKVPLLCNTGGIFETLESHQVSCEKFPVLDCLLNLDNICPPIHFVYQSTHAHTHTHTTYTDVSAKPRGHSGSCLVCR